MLKKYYDTVENNSDNDESLQGGGSFWSNLNRSQKISTIFLAFFSVFLFIFWASDFHRKLREPFLAYTATDESEVVDDVASLKFEFNLMKLLFIDSTRPYFLKYGYYYLLYLVP